MDATNNRFYRVMDRDDAIDWMQIVQKKYLRSAQCNLAGKTAAQIIGDWCQDNSHPRWNAGHLISALESAGFEIILKPRALKERG